MNVEGICKTCGKIDSYNAESEFNNEDRAICTQCKNPDVWEFDPSEWMPYK